MRLANRFQATQLLIQYNMRLLANVARRYEGRGIELEDLIVEGTQGLERAIVRFDPSKGYKFSTYAYMWIRQSISRCISENARIVRLPSHVYEVPRSHYLRSHRLVCVDQGAAHLAGSLTQSAGQDWFHATVRVLALGNALSGARTRHIEARPVSPALTHWWLADCGQDPEDAGCHGEGQS